MATKAANEKIQPHYITIFIVKVEHCSEMQTKTKTQQSIAENFYTTEAAATAFAASNNAVAVEKLFYDVAEVELWLVVGRSSHNRCKATSHTFSRQRADSAVVVSPAFCVCVYELIAECLLFNKRS